ncbi:MAG: hypothetical protein WCG11_10130, partial [Methylococcaceae bacterium]
FYSILNQTLFCLDNGDHYSISLTQTAEGALGSLTDTLQRMRDLAVAGQDTVLNQSVNRSFKVGNAFGADREAQKNLSWISCREGDCRPLMLKIH